VVRLQGIDYRYCKGCLKCTDVCPTNSLNEQREEEGYAEAHRVPHYPWLEAAEPQARAATGGGTESG
jgi:formate hydrogenlyase subunit 6/NADH:ubiquinone oxidoreductase subunit I